MPGFILLTAIDPITGFLLAIGIGLPFQLVFNLLWTGIIRLLKIDLGKSIWRVFRWHVLSTFSVTLFFGLNLIYNYVGRLERSFGTFDLMADEGKLTPVGIVILWLIISLLTTLLFRASARRNKREIS